MGAHDSPFPRFQRARRAAQGGWHDDHVEAQLHMRLRAGPEAAGEGRHALDRLEGLLDENQLSELRLLVTELVTNSVRHGCDGREWIGLDVEICASNVRAVVTDRGPGFELAGAPQPHSDRPGGWGLCLVDRLSDRWGVDVSDETRVWFELARDELAAAA